MTHRTMSKRSTSELRPAPLNNNSVKCIFSFLNKIEQHCEVAWFERTTRNCCFVCFSDGMHAHQDSMEVNCSLDERCKCEILKPLERRRQREGLRCLAHSLVGTPNYIAPEVLLRQGEQITLV